MNRNKEGDFFKNELGSVVIGVIFGFLLIYFFGSEVFGIWKPVSPHFIEISFISMLVLKCFSFIGWYLALEDETIKLEYKEVLFFGYAATIAINILIVDFKVYPEYSVAALYALLVPFGWFLEAKNGSMLAAYSAVVLSISTFLFLDTDVRFYVFFIDRITALVVILMLGVFLNYFKKIKVKLGETNKSLNLKILESELKAKELEQFVYTVSNDLKEPLRALTVIIDIFMENNKDILKDEDLELLGLVKKSSFKMGRSIQSMLDYSKLGQDFNLEELQINKVLNDVLYDMNTLIKSSNVAIDVKDLGVLNVFLVDFKLLFTNIIDNAIRYRKQDEICRIAIWRTDTERFAIFHIKDNGVGIEKVNHERIFKIFQGLETQERRKGIGLAHCSKIAELHKGNISVISERDKGSVFVVKIAKNLVSF